MIPEHNEQEFEAGRHDDPQHNREGLFLGYDQFAGQVPQAHEGDASLDLLHIGENEGAFEPFG